MLRRLPKWLRPIVIVGGTGGLILGAIALFVLFVGGDGDEPSDTLPPVAATETTVSDTTPPETTPPETTPPETLPPETLPPETTPPETTPAETVAGLPPYDFEIVTHEYTDLQSLIPVGWDVESDIREDFDEGWMSQRLDASPDLARSEDDPYGSLPRVRIRVMQPAPESGLPPDQIVDFFEVDPPCTLDEELTLDTTLGPADVQLWGSCDGFTTEWWLVFLAQDDGSPIVIDATIYDERDRILIDRVIESLEFTRLDITPLTEVKCQSDELGPETPITVVNEFSEPVHVVWHTETCEAVSLQILVPGEVNERITVAVGDLLTAGTLDGITVAEFEVDSENATWTIP